MIPFLCQVARHYFAAGGLDKTCFVFPNRRAVVFFRKYLGECVKESGRPLLAPSLFTMNDFFYTAAEAVPTARVPLLLELYSCYRQLYPEAESLDEFIFWGDILLGDFGDVDKYLVKPEALFRNVAEFRGMQDGMEYLDDTQLAAITRFLSHFSTGGRYKEEFRKIWDILLPLYKSFNAALETKGMSYEGQVYRRLAERVKNEPVADVVGGNFPGVEKFVFVGLNALNECEKLIMRRLRNAGMAEFCWDYSSDMIRDSHNRSSFFLADNVNEFPQAFRPDADGLPEPEFHVLSVPSSVGQAKQLPAILDRVGAKGIETAIVLPDENLLMPVLNSIPEHIRDINVTMGYPMKNSGLWSLMHDIGSMQLRMRMKGGEWYFYREQLRSIFANSVFAAVCSDEDRQVVAEVQKQKSFYLSAACFAASPLLSLIFKPVLTEPGKADKEQIARLAAYQLEVVNALGMRMKGTESMSLELDFARDYCIAVESLASYGLELLPQSYFRLLDSLVGRATVPFKGEPLNGLQIMGPLETRALDFENIVLLSCNEGTFPQRNVAPSFIPAELRRGFGLPTYEFQDAVWSYYFYRMVQRASRVWLVCDSRSSGLKGGEESRYIRQLEMHFWHKLHRHVYRADIRRAPELGSIPKTEEDVRKMKKLTLSASTLKEYLSCEVKFYYSRIRGLKVQEEAEEALDAGGLGSVFHAVMQELYTVPGGKLSKEYLKKLVDSGSYRKRVRELIMEETGAFEIYGQNLINEDLLCRYVRQVLKRDVELLESYGKDSLEVLGLERECYSTIDGFRFKGVIDRLDRLTPGTVRIVDYKTGYVDDDDFKVDAGVAEKVFGPDNKKRPNIALQLYLYDRFVSDIPEFSGKQLVNSIYQTSRLFTNSVEEVELNEEFIRAMGEGLSGLLESMTDLDRPFTRDESGTACTYCNFKILCGR